MTLELGSFSDNAAILTIAASAIEAGAPEDALPVLRSLRDRMEDAKSRRWLLPEVNRLIEVAERAQNRHQPPRRGWRVPSQGQLESGLIKLASLASLIATILRIVVSETLRALTPHS